MSHNQEGPAWFKVKSPESLAEQRVDLLQRLVNIQKEHDSVLNVVGKRFMCRTIFTVYQSCVEGGKKAVADEIIKKAPLRLKVRRPESLAQDNLDRLRIAVQRLKNHYGDLNDRGKKVYSKSLFSIYADCIESGIRSEANEIISQGIPEVYSRIMDEFEEDYEKIQKDPELRIKGLGPIILEDE